MKSFDPAINCLKQRIGQLQEDREYALENETYNRIKGDDLLIEAYKLAVRHLEFEQETINEIDPS